MSEKLGKTAKDEKWGGTGSGRECAELFKLFQPISNEFKIFYVQLNFTFVCPAYFSYIDRILELQLSCNFCYERNQDPRYASQHTI